MPAPGKALSVKTAAIRFWGRYHVMKNYTIKYTIKSIDLIVYLLYSQQIVCSINKRNLYDVQTYRKIPWIS